MYYKMNLKRITQNYYPPVHETEKRRYLKRVAEEVEAEEEIKGYDNGELLPTNRDSYEGTYKGQ